MLFFWLLTIFFYSRYVKQPATARYLIALATMALGLMSKPMVVTLPFVLLLLDFWPLSRPGTHFLNSGINVISLKKFWPLVWEKIPFFVLVAVSSVVTIYAQKHGGAVTSIDILDPGTRASNAIYSYFMYIEKMLMPFDLAVLYPYPKTLSMLKIIGPALVLVGVFVLSFRLRKKFPYLLVGWLWYIGTMVPVIGLVQVGTQAMADRYTYIPLIGLFIIISWGAFDLIGKLPKAKVWAVVSAALLFPIIMTMTWAQTGYWKNSITLFEHTLKVTTGNQKAHINLGNALDLNGQTQQAIEHYLMALQINPESDIANNNLGKVLDGQGRTHEAIEHYFRALQINPDFELAHNNLGKALDGLGRTQEAIKHYLMALEVNPDLVIAHNNVGLAFEKIGSREIAIKHYQRAIQINPDFANAYHNLGVTLFRAGQLELAVTHLQKAVQIDPDYILAKQNLEKALKVLEQQNKK